MINQDKKHVVVVLSLDKGPSINDISSEGEGGGQKNNKNCLKLLIIIMYSGFSPKMNKRGGSNNCGDGTFHQK